MPAKLIPRSANAASALTAAVVICICLAAGCSRSPQAVVTNAVTQTEAASYAGVFVDDSGETLVFQSPPARIIAAAPSLTEIVAALGRTGNLIAVSRFSDYPPEVSDLPKCGSYVRLNIEAIVAMKPDLLLAVKEGPPKSDIEKLRSLGIKVAVLDSADFPGVVRNIRWLSEVLGCGDTGTRMAAELERRYAAIRQIVAGEPALRALYVIALKPVITVGRGSFIHDIMEDAGTTNIAGDIEDGYPRLTLESVIERQPEVILFSGGMGSEARSEAMHEYWRQWPQIPAVRDGRLIEINTDLINRAGPRIVGGLASIASKVHPHREAEIEKALAE